MAYTSEHLLDSVNEQGQLFQQRVYAELQSAERATGWRVRAYDYPISDGDLETKVDLVLEHDPAIFAVECKRVNPEYVSWVFLTTESPSDRAGAYVLRMVCNQARSDMPLDVVRSVEKRPLSAMTYSASAWLEVKSKGAARGNQRHSNVQKVEDAIIQVLHGVNGLAQERLKQRQKARTIFEDMYVPVIVTSAPLFVAEYSIRDVDLKTGTIPPGKMSFGPAGQDPEPVDWVLLHYGAGRSITQDVIPEYYHGTDVAQLAQHKLRSVFVVNSAHVVQFFAQLA